MPGPTTPLPVWTSESFPVPLPPGHRFPTRKAARIREQLIAEGVLGAEDVHASTPAPRVWLEQVHDRAWVDRVLAGALTDAEVRRVGLPWSEALVARARAAVDGTVRAARAAVRLGLAGNLAGGSHHAFRDRGAGYCLFNDIAIAIAVLRAEGAAARPFVCDLDVHQGDGTAALFADDASVFTFSMHAAHNFPARKERSTLDVPLPDGCDDARYLAALSAQLPQAFAAHAPDLIVYQAGVDALADDRLGRLALTHAGLRARDAMVFTLAEAHGVPVVVTMGGGYAEPIEASIEAHANVWRAMRISRARRDAAHGVHRPAHDGDTAKSA